MHRFTMSTHFVLPCAFAIAGSAHAAVRVVDATHGPFLTIQSAIDAASAGDLVLIETGMYGGFTIDGKAVSVIVDVDANVAINGSAVVKNLPASANIALSRLKIQGPAALGAEEGAALRVVDCAGHVRIEVCTLRGGDGGKLSPSCGFLGHPDAGAGLVVRNSNDVAVTLSSLTGGKGQYVVTIACDGMPANAGDGGSGISVTDSIFAIYDSVATGGLGGTAWWTGGDAGDGIAVRDNYSIPGTVLYTRVFASNVVFDGSADGGDAVDYFCCPTPGSGGSAISAQGLGVVRFLDCSLLSGISGSNIWGTGNIAAPLIDSTGGASVSEIPGNSQGLGIPRLLREGQSSVVTFQGGAGESCFLLLAAQMEDTYFGALKGSLLLATPFIGPIGFGALGGSGSLQIPITAPALPSGFDSIAVELQGWITTGPGTATLTSSAHLTILSASF